MAGLRKPLKQPMDELLDLRKEHYCISNQDCPESQTNRIYEGVYQTVLDDTKLRSPKCLLKVAEPGESVNSQMKKLGVLEEEKVQLYNIYPRLKAWTLPGEIQIQVQFKG